MSRATSSEKNTAAATVRPNCLKYCPVMPPMKLTGRNTAMMVEEVATTASPISIGRIERGLEAALAHAHVAHDVLDLDDGIVDQHARHQRQRQQGDRVEREAHPAA